MTPDTKMRTSRTLRIAPSPLNRFRKSAPVASRCSLGGKNWITLDVDPVRRPGRDVATQAVLLVVRRDLLVGRIGLEKRPSPSIAPQWIAGVASFFVFDHDEPHFRSGSPMRVSGRHLGVIGSQDLFHQNSSIGKLSVLAVILGRIGGSVGKVHLITLGIEHRIRPERLVVVAVVTRFTN